MGHCRAFGPKEEVTLTEMIDYFEGGHTVTVPKEGYDDIAVIPGCEPKVVEEAVAAAVERGNIWLTNGPASVFQEQVPTGILTLQATLNQPPEPISSYRTDIRLDTRCLERQQNHRFRHRNRPLSQRGQNIALGNSQTGY